MTQTAEQVLPKVNERWSDEKGDYVFVLSDKRYPGHGRIVEFIYKGYSDEKRWEIDEKGNLAFSNPVGSTHYTIRQVGDQIFIFDGYGDKRISAIHKVLKGP